jgi:two-component system, cell cycle response regulator
MIDPRKIWSSSQLPTLPTVAVRLLDLSRNPDADLKDVIAVIKADPAISAKILKSTNSSFFGFRSEVTSIERAVPLLGTTVVTSLALSFSLVEAAMNDGPLAAHYNDFWMQSLVQAAAAETLAKHCGRGLDCEYFLTGLLIDIGRLAMLKTVGADYGRLLEAAQQQDRDLHEVERERLGFDHVEIGVQLMKHWKLPDALAAAAASHHIPLGSVPEQQSSPYFELIKSSVVAAAVGDYFCHSNKGLALTRLKRLTHALYDFSPQRLNWFLGETKDRVDQAGELFRVDTGELCHPSDLMALANDQLAQLAMKEHLAGTQAAVQRNEIEREKQELESRNRELQILAIRDPLTNVYNRAYFNDALAKEIERGRQTASTVGVIFSDIDKFKPLNDTYGHQFGDRVLQRVATAFGEVLRRCDVLARFGGEEFVVLVSRPTEKGLAKLAERIRARVEAEDVRLENTRIPVTVSLGAALTIPPREDGNPGNTAELLIEAADSAMYRSKENGRNQAHVRSLLDEHERQMLDAIVQRRFSRWLVKQDVLDILGVSQALLQCPPPPIRLGELAVREEHLDEQSVQRILEAQQDTNERFGTTAIRLGLLTEDQLIHLLVLQNEDPYALAQALVRTGQLAPERGAALLEEYLTEATPPPQPTASLPLLETATPQ